MFPLRDDAPRNGFPLVNTLLIALNVLVYLYEAHLSASYLDHVFIPTWGLIPAHVAALWTGAALPPRRVLVPLFSSMFLHAGWLHLIGNMWMLYLFGDNVEGVLGHGRYLAAYLGCGVIGGLVQSALLPHSVTPTIGASGAIAGVMGAYLLCFPRARVKTLVFVLLIFFLDIPAWVILGYWFLVQFLSGAGALALGAAGAGGIAWFAHIGGFLSGAVIALLAVPTQRGPTRRAASATQ